MSLKGDDSGEGMVAVVGKRLSRCEGGGVDRNPGGISRECVVAEFLGKLLEGDLVGNGGSSLGVHDGRAGVDGCCVWAGCGGEEELGG